MSTIINITKSVVNEVLMAISTVSAYVLFHRGVNIAQNENKFSGTAIKEKKKKKPSSITKVQLKTYAVH